MPDINELVPDQDIIDAAGSTHRLWDYRQKTHLVLLIGPQAQLGSDVLKPHKKMLDWLGVSVVECAQQPETFSPGASGIDRYGRYMGSWTIDQDLYSKIEKEFLYYEARHC